MGEPVLFSGTIVEVNVEREGISQKNGKPYKVWAVHAIPEGEIAPIKFSSWESSWKDLVGQKVAFFYEKQVKGQFTNLVILKDPAKDTQKMKRATNDRARVEVLDAINRLESKLDAALEWIRERG